MFVISTGIPKDKVSDDAPIELTVHARAQWCFPRPAFTRDLHPPLPSSNVLLNLTIAPAVSMNNCIGTSSSTEINSSALLRSQACSNESEESSDEKWLSEVEITTHSGPHRRLWMGPQFTFKVFNPSS